MASRSPITSRTPGAIDGSRPVETVSYDPGNASSMAAHDIVPPENFLRGWLDRNIGVVNSFFAKAFDLDNAPLQVAVDRLRATGRVALFDVGCGTGNTLRTWATAVRRHAETPQQVDATGLTLHDYSNESMFPQTRRAVQAGEIAYIIGNAEHMPEVSTAAADVLLAYMSVFHMSRPELALSEMDRIARPGSVSFLNIHGSQNVSDSPFMERIYTLEERGYTVDTCIGITPDPGYGLREALFVRIEKP